MRPGWADYFLGIAEAVGPAPTGRADCTRRKVGAVITVDNRIVSCGYNGAPSGEGSCLAGDCPRGRHYHKGYLGPGMLACACGAPWPCPEAVPPGSSYDTGPGGCIAIHAEFNACLYAGEHAARGGTIWIAARDGQGRITSAEPCAGCWRVIKATGIAAACWRSAQGITEYWRKSDAPGK